MIAVAAMLFSCETDIERVKTVTTKDSLPVQSAKNIEVLYSKSGIVEIKLTAPLLNRYLHENPYMEFPEGVKVLFYDSLMSVKSNLTANYAISWEKRKIMEAKNNVVVVNEKDETLNTEHLIWDERKKKIYSDVFVKITSPTEIIIGEGFEADESFDRWVIKKVKGTFSVEEE